MTSFIQKYGLYLLTALSLGTTIFMIATWDTMPVTQILVCFFLIALTLHEWEEMRFPGGFVDMVITNMHLPIKNLDVAKTVLFLYTIFIVAVPFFLPEIAWLTMAPMLIGVVEVFAHLAATRLNKNKKFYSPGMITSFLMLAVSVFGIYYIVSNNLMAPLDWLWAVIFMLVPLLFSQAMIVKSNGMKYSEFMKNARSALFSRKDTGKNA